MNVLPSGQAVVAGVVGWPVKHSRSPFLHGYWLQQHAIDGIYAPFPVRPDDFDAAIRGLAAAGIVGLNITFPHKKTAFDLCDSADDTAKMLGAANTLVFAVDGLIHGKNTDVFGFLENLRRAGSLGTNRPAVVLGSGGAARAVVLGLRRWGFQTIRLTNRTRARAEAMHEALGGAMEIIDWSDRHAMLAGAGLVVNTTVLGMSGQPPLDLALDDLPAGALVNDIVYTPLETPLLAAARARGNPVLDGLGMLLHQGRPAFEAWFGIDPVAGDAVRQAVADNLSEASRCASSD